MSMYETNRPWISTYWWVCTSRRNRWPVTVRDRGSRQHSWPLCWLVLLLQTWKNEEKMSQVEGFMYSFFLSFPLSVYLCLLSLPSLCLFLSPSFNWKPFLENKRRGVFCVSGASGTLISNFDQNKINPGSSSFLFSCLIRLILSAAMFFVSRNAVLIKFFLFFQNIYYDEMRGQFWGIFHLIAP